MINASDERPETTRYYRARLDPSDVSILRAISLFRLLAVALIVAIAIFSRAHMQRPALAATVITVAAAFSGLWWVLVSAAGNPIPPLAAQPRWLLSALCALEMVIATALLASDRFVWDTDPGQRLASAWPVAALLTIGALFGPRIGAFAGAALGAGNAVAVAGLGAAFGWVGDVGRISANLSPLALSIASTTALFVLAGAVAGVFAQRIRVAERRVVAARVRESMAAELHDGVLQTLAAIQRRSADESLARLARDQELELRAYLREEDLAEDSGGSPTTPHGPSNEPGASGPATSFESLIRRRADRTEQRFGVRITLNVLDDDAVPAAVRDPLAGAVSEAIANAAKHAGADAITVFVDGGADPILATVRDQGAGFDPSSAPTDRGITNSIVRRAAAVGGSATITSSVGSGTEVEIRIPRTRAADRSPRDGHPSPR